MTRHNNQDVPARLAIGSNPERNRRHNRRVVLEAIRTHGALGRTEIGRLTQLTAQAVANIVDDLRRDNFLIETGRRRTGRSGRRTGRACWWRRGATCFWWTRRRGRTGS